MYKIIKIFFKKLNNSYQIADKLVSQHRLLLAQLEEGEILVSRSKRSC